MTFGVEGKFDRFWNFMYTELIPSKNCTFSCIYLCYALFAWVYVVFLLWWQYFCQHRFCHHNTARYTDDNWWWSENVKSMKYMNFNYIINVYEYIIYQNNLLQALMMAIHMWSLIVAGYLANYGMDLKNHYRITNNFIIYNAYFYYFRFIVSFQLFYYS